MTFDVEGARKAGYSEAEIVDFLAQERKFDAPAARQSGYSDAEILRQLTVPQRSAGERVARAAGLFGAGFNERLAQTVGALPDLYNRGLRAVGLPAMEPGAYTSAIQGGINAVVGEPPKPETTTEELARGAGAGLVDVGTILVPAARVAQATAPLVGQAPSMTNRVAGVLAGQPVLQTAAGMTGGAVGEATDNPLLGTAAAFAVPVAASVARRVITPAQGPIDPVRDQLAAIAQREGITLRPGQETGSRALQNVEAALEFLPTTAGTQANLIREQADDFTRAVLRRAGLGSSRATPEILAQADTTIGGRIGELTARRPAQFTPSIEQRYLDLVDTVSRQAEPTIRDRVLNRLDDVMALVQRGGAMDGRAVRELDTAIGTQIRESEGDVRRYLRGVQDILRDTVTASAWQAGARRDIQDLRQARREFANLVRIEDAMAGAGAQTAEGVINPNALRATLARGDRRAAAMGRGDLAELSRVGQAFIRPSIGNSYSPERTFYTNAMTGGGIGGGIGGGAVMFGADPLTAALAAATTLAGPKAVQIAYNQPLMQQWMTNRLLRNAGPEINRGLAAALLAQETVPQVTAP